MLDAPKWDTQLFQPTFLMLFASLRAAVIKAWVNTRDELMHGGMTEEDYRA